MKCIICGVGTARKVHRKRSAKYNGESVEVPRAEAYRCEECGEEFLTPEQAREYTKTVKNEVRKKLGLLPPDRIAAIRHKAGLSQEELERLLSHGPKVITRWESGKVIQNKDSDTVLRLMEREPELVIKYLKAIAEQRCEEQKSYAGPRAGAAGPNPCR